MVTQVVSEPASRPQAPWIARALTLAAIAELSAIPFIPAGDRYASIETHAPLLAIMAATLVLALLVRAWSSAHVALIATLYLGSYCAFGSWWPLPLAVILALYGLAVLATPSLRGSVRFWTRGRVDRWSALSMVVFTVVAATALVLWRIYFAGDDIERFRGVVPDGVPAWAVLAGIVPYAMFNAAFEELVWRGALWQASEDAFGGKAALAITSLSFGLAHFRGFPSGILGVLLACIYGVMMGVVRYRTRGLFYPWVAHIFADVVIYSMVAVMVITS
jgi:uncharacterized protein